MPGRPEILAPAGDADALRAALAAGADAVYFGLDDGFNARARATNFSVDDLPDVVARIHRAGARAHITLNTLVFEPELPVVEALIRRIAAAGVDAIIVQDPAVALIARAACPQLAVHASTQMTVSSPLAARMAADLGVRRVVVPRELSVDEIRTYAAGTPLELEVFIHGALCVSWSGQCLTSESWGGRSANRGQCAQSCRLPYELVVDGVRRDLGDVAYLLSPSDLAGLAAVPALAEIGVASLKIEGRQKGPQYVATAVASYRRRRDGAIDGSADADPAAEDAALAADVTAMALSYSRGFTPGFLAGSDHQRLVEGRSPRHRGVYLGRVVSVRGDDVVIADEAEGRPWTGALANAIRPDGPEGRTATELAALPAPSAAPRPGMGVVFDDGHPEASETGGPLFRVDRVDASRGLAAGWRLGFGRPGPQLDRVAPGQRVWLTSDPQLVQGAERAIAAGAGALGRIAVHLEVGGSAGAPLWLRARAGRHVVELATDVALAASRPTPSETRRRGGLDAALLTDKLGALGGTSFHLAGLDASGLAPGLHLPVSALKELRRRAVVALEAEVVRVDRVVATASVLSEIRTQATAGIEAAADGPPRIVALCRTDAQLDAVLAAGADEVELDWMEMVGLGRAVARARARGVRVGVATVRVQKPGEDKLDAHLARLEPDALLIRSWGALEYFRERYASVAEAARPRLHGDFSLNVTNGVTAGFVLGRGLDTVTAAHDLDAIQLAAVLAATPAGRVAVTVHHHIPTFHTEHCVYAHLLSGGRDYRSCGRPCEQHEVALADRVGLVHPVVVDVGCRNTVFNAQAQSAASLVPRLIAAGVRRLRVELVRETGDEAARVLDAYRGLVAGTLTPDEVLRRTRVHEQFGVTRGTMKTLTVVT